MIIELPLKNREKIVATYEIEAGNQVTFKVILKESSDGTRNFEITASQNASDDYSEVFEHPFYKNFVLPWSCKEKDIDRKEAAADNVVQLSKFNRKK